MVNLITVAEYSINVEQITVIAWNVHTAFGEPCDRISLAGNGLNTVHLFDADERAQLRAALRARGHNVPEIALEPTDGRPEADH